LSVAAVIQMGDPSHKVGVSGNVGTSRQNGITPRRDTSKVANFNVQSYCDMGDVFCDRGFNQATHLSLVLLSIPSCTLKSRNVAVFAFNLLMNESFSPSYNSYVFKYASQMADYVVQKANSFQIPA
jgi:hypothetical protein